MYVIAKDTRDGQTVCVYTVYTYKKGETFFDIDLMAKCKVISMCPYRDCKCGTHAQCPCK